MLSEMRLIKSAMEYRPISEVSELSPGLRGIYVLFKKRAGHLNVVYVGMSAKKGRMRSRLRIHMRQKEKLWTHFSYYEVWENISDDEILDLEGLFKHIYRFDSRANSLNIQQVHKPLLRVRKATEDALGRTRTTLKRIFGG
ncbi:MAG: hypothetical protein ABJ013_16150 [Halioglobus sp.]